MDVQLADQPDTLESNQTLDQTRGLHIQKIGKRYG